MFITKAKQYVNLALVFQDTMTKLQAFPHKPATAFDFTAEEAVTVNVPLKDKKTKIEVINQDTFEAVEPLVKKYTKTAVLNLASDRCPGGGVWKGCRAQEEDLCRRSNLYMTLDRSMYPFNAFTTVWSPEVVVVKDTQYNKLQHPFTTSVISAAAMRHPKLDSKGRYSKADHDIMTAKIRCILWVAQEQKVEALVLGAFGCGVFANPPDIVAKIFRKLLETEFLNVFDHVVFAVLDTKNEGNFEQFNKVLGEQLKLELSSSSSSTATK